MSAPLAPPHSPPALFVHISRPDITSSFSSSAPTPSLSEAPCSPLSDPPSSPLSELERTPSPPVDYPSPPVSNVSDQENARAIRVATPEPSNGDGPPPAKKRKVYAQRPRTMERLDLYHIGESPEPARREHQDQQLKRLVATLRGKRKIVVVAGAGISVSAGIPDFRSATGLFTTLRSQHKLKSSGKELFDASVYKNDISTTSFHSMVRELAHLTQRAEPTPFHHLLASIAEDGRLMRLYTQNVDGIDTALEPLSTRVPLNVKGPWPKSIQLHGGLEKMVCSKCGALSDFDGPLFEGPEAPSCPSCVEMDEVRLAGGLRSHGIGCLRPRMVLYNEFNPDSDAIGNVSHADLKSRPDAVIVVGTSLKVPGIRRLVKELCAVTKGRRGGFTAWINRDEPAPEFRDCWDMIVRGDSDEVARHVNLPSWDDKTHHDFSLVLSEEERELAARTCQASVEVPSMEVPESELDNMIPSNLKTTSLASIKQTKGVPTPAPSPRKQSPNQVDAFLKMKRTPAAKDAPKVRTALPTTKPKVPKKKAASMAKKTIEMNTIKSALKISKSTKVPTAKRCVDTKGSKETIKTPFKVSKSTSTSTCTTTKPASKPASKPLEPKLYNFSTHFAPKVEHRSVPKVTSDSEALLSSMAPSTAQRMQPPMQTPSPHIKAEIFDDSPDSIDSFHTAMQTPSPPRGVLSGLNGEGGLIRTNNATISSKSMPNGMQGLIDP